MGRSKRRKSNQLLENSSDVENDSKQKVPVDKILDKAEENIDTFNYEVAQKFCQRALELEPENLRALEMTATLLLETGDLDGASECLCRAVNINPQSGFSKYLSLGQLNTGSEAIKYYNKGIEILLKEIQEAENSAAKESGENLVRSLSSVYCSIAEIYMTDCCFEEKAEELCSSHIEKAISCDPANPEAYQLMASFLLVKEDFTKAREMIEKSLSLWLPQYRAMRESQTETVEDVEICPLSYQSRIDAVKILIELEIFEEAADILNGLTDEDDEVVETWYLLGWMNNLRGEEYHGNARFYLTQCKTVAAKIGFDDDKDMMTHVDELLDSLGPDEEEENKENEGDIDDNDDDYEDIESSDEEMEV